jgi:hypothetical protein
MNGRRVALALAECGLARRFHRPALQKVVNASQTSSETILCMDALRAMLASTFYPSVKLTEFSLASSGALCEMPLRSAALY